MYLLNRPGLDLRLRTRQRAGAVAVPPSGLLTNLISYWKMDETSGTRFDSVVASGNDLTDNNTVASNTGIISNAAEFVIANSENLTHADNDGLSAAQADWTGAAWVYLAAKTTLQVIWHKFDTSAGLSDYSLFYDNSADRFTAYAYGSDGIDGVVASNLGSPSTATWYFIVFWRDQTAGTVNIKVNNGTTNSASITRSPASYAGSVRIGGVATAFMGGRIDEVAWWKRKLTATEMTNLYNAGAGITYPFTGVA